MGEKGKKSSVTKSLCPNEHDVLTFEAKFHGEWVQELKNAKEIKNRIRLKGRSLIKKYREFKNAMLAGKKKVAELRQQEELQAQIDYQTTQEREELRQIAIANSLRIVVIPTEIIWQ